MASKTLLWTYARRKRFAAEIAKLVKAGAKRDYVFIFDGHEFILSYAQYLLEYIEAEQLAIKVRR